MKIVFQIISWAALIGTILPSMLYCAGTIPLEQVKWIMLISTIAWFVATPFWMNQKSSDQ